MSDLQARSVEPPNLELKELNRENKSLKHKHKSKRATKCDCSKEKDLKYSASFAASSGRVHILSNRNSKVNREDELQKLLAGKIAEIEVGGDENLEAPIDLSGIYQDEALVMQLRDKVVALTQSENISAEVKVTELANNIVQLSEQIELMQKKIGELNAKYTLLKQRKDTVSTKLVKTNNSKAKLEQLCRELQKQNKLIVSESRRIADEEDQKSYVRRDLSAQFKKTIEEVSAKMDMQGQDYVSSLKENEILQQKLNTFLEQYTAREEHFDRQLEAKDLSVQLAEAKLQHQIQLTSCESKKVKITLDKAQEFSEREIHLQSQLNSYSKKFDVVQETLTKSNQMFTSFREEMNKMAKTTKKLEKENVALRKKCAEYDSGAIATIHEKVTAAEETLKLQEKVKKLESLCRHLQAERNSNRQT
ncbi:uncharacterized protein CCR75_007936 [Bremia lactucae]|uniref:Alpha-taxilin n=1 Tax=Bremia lactucae TaxID=4779 RepID=A0A976IJ33_BRELC|nr:hypothetical protein CCR75_007936 [Bremia lactucae]